MHRLIPPIDRSFQGSVVDLKQDRHNARFMADEDSIQGVAPGQTVEAWNQTELAGAIQRAAAQGTPIVDYGRFHRGLGHPPPADHVRIVQASGVIEHHVADMTVRVRAATTLREIARHLIDQRQWLPLDGAEGTITISEAIAHNVYGPLRVGFGSLRDLLLGLKFMNHMGEEIAVGGRTVKNVAGYDVTKFMVGSLNTLGVITEATLRTWAIPEQVTMVTLPELSLTLLGQHMSTLIASDATPTYLDAQRAPGGTLVTHVGYAGSAASCAAQFHALRQWLIGIGYDPKAKGARRVDQSLIKDAGDRAQRIGWRANAAGLVKLIVQPGHLGQAIEAMTELRLPADTYIDALPMHGTAWVGGPWTSTGADLLDHDLTVLAKRFHGVRIWMQRPEGAEYLVPAAPPQADWPILRALQRTFDPNQLFNPGRMFGRST